jgi:hypothetical protein
MNFNGGRPMDLERIFVLVVDLLAALAVIGGLVFVIVAEVLAIRAKLAAYRQAPQDVTEDFWRGRVVTIPQGRKWQ